MRIGILAAAGLLIMPGGCTQDTAGGPGASAYYDCGAGIRLKVDLVADDMIEVRVNQDQPIRIPAIKAASGARYMSATHQFWDKGGEAMWTVGRMAPMTCRKVAVPRGV